MEYLYTISINIDSISYGQITLGCFKDWLNNDYRYNVKLIEPNYKVGESTFLIKDIDLKIIATYDKDLNIFKIQKIYYKGLRCYSYLEIFDLLNDWGKQRALNYHKGCIKEYIQNVSQLNNEVIKQNITSLFIIKKLLL